MQKKLSLLLALLLSVALPLGAWATGDEVVSLDALMQEETAAQEPAEDVVLPTEAPAQVYTPPAEPVELVVGTPTEMSGCFFNELWGNNTADMDVRSLLHGYATVAWERNGNYGVDYTVVKEVQATEDEAGNKTYRFVLFEDLVYNDGTPITARDYVFSAMLLSAPETEQIGGVTTTLQHVLGYEGFSSGKRPFSGVRLLGDYEFSITISAEYLPYFYELMMVSITPCPMEVIAPGCSVQDDGQGTYIEGPFTAELLEETILNPDTGYLYMPYVTSGPYSLVNYNRVTREASFEINPLYKGNFEGQKPSIDKLVFRQVYNDTMMEQLESGEVDLVNKVTSGNVINQGLELASKQQLSTINYLRSGMTFISFACEMGPTQSEWVRHAIAMCVDGQKITDEYLKGYGLPVYGYYGYGQWMAAENQERLLELAAYEINLDGAITQLVEGGWVLNAQGDPYNPDLDAVRYRRNEEGELEELFIRWARPMDSGMSDMLQQMLEENMPQVGFRLEVTPMSFVDLLFHYYRQEPRTYNMFNLASNFSHINDPYYTFHTGEEYQGIFNTTGIQDEHLMELAKEMREVPSGDNVEYIDKWMAFQTYWAQVLPMVPLYSNIYFDFHRVDLRDYYVNSYWSWGAAILYAYVGEERDTGLEFPEDEDGLDTLVFDDDLPAESDSGEPANEVEELEGLVLLD